MNPSAGVTLFTGGRIYTLDPAGPAADALLVRGEEILATADARDAARGFPGYARVDLGGHAVLPGLIDSHIHFLSFGLSLRRVELRETRSLADAVGRVAQAAAQTPEGGWIIGRGWDKNLWAEGRWPTRHDLDPVTGARPAALTSKDGHLLWVNSAALAAAGVGRQTPNPAAGEIVRDQTGAPTGLLKERATEPIYEVVRRPDRETLRAGAREATAAAHRLGLTAVHDMEGSEAFALFQELRREDALEVRVWMTVPVAALEHARELGLRTGLGDDWLRVGGVKIFADGTLGSQTAAMLEPFEGQRDNRGISIYTPEALGDLIGGAAGAGLWPVVHAIGDRANREVLDALADHAGAVGAAGARPRIEHVQLVHPADLPRFARLGVIASMQPIHATSDRDIADRYWGARSRTAYPWRTLLASGAGLAFGSDAPVETPDPWQGLYAAVTRRRPQETRSGWYPEERVTVDEAIRAYTVGAAVAAGQEGRQGRLAPGYLADFIVADRDIMEEAPRNPEALLETRVLLTVVGGRSVYAAGPFAGLEAGRSG